MRPLRAPRLAVAVVLAAGSVLGGDPDVADLLLKKGKKAFSAKSYDEAESALRRALKEMTPFPEARLCLGETLEKLERGPEALEMFRACVKEIEQEGDPAKWRSLRTRAQQAISRLKGKQGELAKLNDTYIRKYLDLGRKWAGSNPAWARKAFETVLLLDPGNEIAKGYLKQLPADAPAPSAAEKPKPAGERFGESIVKAELWSGAEEWSVGERTIVGDTEQGRLFWLEEMPLSGRFSVRGRFRLTRMADRFRYGVFLGSTGREPWWAVFVTPNSVSLDRCEEDANRAVKETFLEDFDHKGWHTLQIDVRPGDVKVTLDGKECYEHNEADRKAFDGKICLFVQFARIEWRDLEVRR